MIVKSVRIDKDNFQSFGVIFKLPSSEPTAATDKYKFWSDIAHYQIVGETEIGICTAIKQAENQITSVERHLHTPEILIPIDAPFVVPLFSEKNQQTPLKAFQVNIGEGVVINKGVWHGAGIPVGRDESSYFVIFRRGTPFKDVDEKSITPVIIEV